MDELTRVRSHALCGAHIYTGIVQLKKKTLKSVLLYSATGNIIMVYEFYLTLFDCGKENAAIKENKDSASALFI